MSRMLYYLPVEERLILEVVEHLNKASQLLRKIGTKKQIPYVPLASREEKDEYARDKKAQRAVAISQEERARSGGVPYRQFRKELGLE